MQYLWKVLRTSLFGLGATLTIWGGTEYPAKPGEQVVANQLLVRYLPGTTVSSVQASLVPGAQVRALAASLPGVFLIQLPPGTPQGFSTQLSHHVLVDYVEPNRVRGLNITAPNDPSLSSQYALTKVLAQQAWQLIPNVYLTSGTAGTSRIRVAIIDTGADCTHEDFKNGGSSADAASGGQIVFSASKVFSVFSTAPNPQCAPWQDDNGHGTHVSGIVAASTNNGKGVASLGYAVELVEYKVLDSTGSGSDSDVAAAILDAVDNAGANVISMSLGGSGYGQTLQNAINHAWQKNCVIVAAAGNSNSTVSSYPGANNFVLSVAATDSTDTKASFSNFGAQIGIAAPGVSIYSTLPGYPNSMGSTGYGFLSGTSMATPHAAALAGLVEMTTPNLAPMSVVQRIQRAADKPAGSTASTGGWDSNYAYGRIDAYNSVSGTLRSASVGGIVGQVVSPGGSGEGNIGNPVAGATITFQGQSTTTDSVGMYHLRNLTPGFFSGVSGVVVAAAGFTPVILNVTVVAGADTNLTPVLGATTGEFHGTVTDGATPIAGAVVQAVTSSANGPIAIAHAVTDASGN